MAHNTTRFLAEKKTTAEARLVDIINQRIKDELARRRNVVAERRGKFFSGTLRPEIQAAKTRAFGSSDEGDTSDIIPRISRELDVPLEQELSIQELTAGSERLRLLANSAFRIALEKGSSLQQARNYMTEVVRAQRDRERRAAELQAERESTRELVRMESEFAHRGIESAEQERQKGGIDYEALVSAALARMAANIGAGYILGSGKKQQPEQQARFSPDNTYASQFSRATSPYTTGEYSPFSQIRRPFNIDYSTEGKSKIYPRKTATGPELYGRLRYQK